VVSLGEVKWRRWWPAFYIALVTGAAYLAYAHWAYDDPFITFRYAQNLLAGSGFVYNAGQHVLSTTTPLYALLLALLGKVWPNLPALGNLLSALSLAGGGLFLWQLAQAWQTRVVGWVALVLYPTFPFLYTTFGGEMLFYNMLCLATIAWYARRRYALAALAGALALLARADAALLLVLLAAHYLLWRRERSVPWLPVSLFVAISGTWVAFAWWYFGSPIPATLAVKQHQGELRASQSFAQGFAALAVSYGRFWTYRLEAVLAASGVLFALGWRRRWLLLLVWPALFFFAYTALGVSRYFWYYAPLVPGGVVAVGLGFEAAYAGFRRVRPQASFSRAWLPLAILGFAVMQGGGVWQLRQHPDRRVAIYRAVGTWLAENTGADAQVGVLETGIIGYYAQRPMVDFAGLIYPEVARQLTAQTTYEDAAIWAVNRYHPRYLVLHDGMFPRLEDMVVRHCAIEQRFAGAAYGYASNLVIYRCRPP